MDNITEAKKKKKSKNWIAAAIKKPGALKATAKAAGALKPDGTINKSWEKEKAKGSGKTAKRAKLALTLGKMKHEDALMTFLESEEVSDEGDSEASVLGDEEIENDGDIKSKAVLKTMCKRFSRRLLKYKPGLEISVDYRDQRNYTYKLTRRVGIWTEYPAFKPELTPSEILNLGVFEGKKFNDCFREFPREWFLDAIEANKLSVLRPMKKVNYFKVPSVSMVDNWRDEEHDSLMDSVDPRGFLQWYARFYLGRRDPSVDRKQINRWIAFTKKFKKMIEISCKEKDDRCKTKVKQSMIGWAIDPKKL